MKRTIALICAFIMLLCCLTSCKNDKETSDTSSGEILTSELGNYTVVYSGNCGAEVKTKINEMLAKIKSLYGVELKSVIDIMQEASDKEILVGDTNRPESNEFLINMRVKDYGYAAVGSKIVIASASDEYTVKSLEKFITTALNKKKENLTLSEPDIVRGEYDIDDMKLNGESVNGWSVVYPDNYGNSEKHFAAQIRQMLSEKSGYYVRICSDKETVTEKAMVIKTADATGISVSGSVVTLSGNGKDGLMQVCSTVLDVLSDAKAENGVINVKITGDSALAEFLTVMSFNLRFDLTENAGISRADAVVAQIRDLSPDVFGVQEDTAQWCELLDAKLTEYTAVHTTKPIGNDASSQEYLTIYYRTDKFTLVDSGTKWLSDAPAFPSKFSESSIYRAMNYAILERADGEKLCFVNTHLEHTDSESNREIREIARQKQTAVLIEQIQKICEKHGGVASVTVGDFNCTGKETIHATMRKNGYVDCGTNAFTVTSQGTWNSAYHGGTVDKNSDTLDFCYASENDFEICSYKVSADTYNGMYTSDHFPIVIKLLFNN